MSAHLTSQTKIPVDKRFSSRETMPSNNDVISQYQPTYYYAGNTQKNGMVSKVDNKFISHPTRAQQTVSSGNCPSFSCATASLLLMLTAGPRD
jgi:hypothetical protein